MTQPPIDAATFGKLVEMTGGDLEFVDELVDTYLQDGASQIAALEAGAAAGDIDALVRPAHSLKSSSLNLGALVVGELARGLEEAARTGDASDAADQVRAIADAFAAARTSLANERGQRTRG
ncbi:MAG TPA: Hpt domain-containing protein [Candidatus Limnocylindrales bacterium]|nr:Hpt domain-containing protein [Candidatus Limnocylindrales bacterium]